MIILDTDHISVLQHEDTPRAQRLEQKLRQHPDEYAVSAPTLEEQSRSWISMIGRYTDVRQQVLYYDRLITMFRFFANWNVLPFDHRAAAEFQRLRGEKVRVSATDLKIASVAIVRQATLVSSNLRDFERVPGLMIEDWLDE